MAQLSRDRSEMNARIVYWGIPGAGKSQNLQTIHAKLRASNRGKLSHVPTRIDPGVSYEILPIQLGEVRGVKTRLQLIAVPGAPEQAPTRKQLLDRIDGVVVVIDSQAERAEENLASFEELRESLAAYGTALEDVPIVIQYNKRDLSDSFAIEELHRRLGVRGAAVFESVATDGTAILQTLTTISKSVVRMLREQDPEPIPESAPVATAQPRATAPVAPITPIEQAILAEAREPEEAQAAEVAVLESQTLLDQPWDAVAAEAAKGDGARIGADMKIVSVGTARPAGERAVRLPLVLGNEDGETVTLAITIQIDPLLDGGST